jgi:N-acetylmuramoyl-L-alanine amidase
MKRFLSTLIALVLCSDFCQAALVYFRTSEGSLRGYNRTDITDPLSAVAALATPPSAAETGEPLTSAVPPGTRVLGFQIAGETTVLDFSAEIIGNGLDEARLEAIFDQVRVTLEQFDLSRGVRLQAKGQLLSRFLPTSQPVTQPPLAVAAAAATAGLAGKKISLSPGHGLNWSGSSWVTQRPVYCSPLNQEDYHNLEVSQYLDTYLAQDGATVKKYRCFDKNYGNYSPSGHAFWHMAACYWTKQAGYPCSVYASSSGDCNLASGSSELNDAIRAGPVAANYDNTDVHVSLHSNGLSGDCAGAGCPNGTCTYYDSDPEHAAYTLVSSNLAKKVQSALISAIRTKYTDSTWGDRGIGDANGGFAETRVPDRAAILIELAFHDSCDRDALYLRDNFFRSTTMWAVYKGICDYFGTTPTWDYYSYEVVSDDTPLSLAAGSTNTVHIWLRNRGVLWNTAEQFRLGAVGDSDPFSPTTRYDVSGEVGPSKTNKFTLTLIAPATPGTYTTDWRMLRESVTWFGPTVSHSIVVTSGADTQPPSVPAKVIANPVAFNQVNLSWRASTDNVAVAQYRIYRDSALLGSATTTNYSNTGCSSRTAYSYEVSALDPAGNESARSAAVQATTPPLLDLILDNTDATLSPASVWSTGTSSTDKYGADYRYDGTAATQTSTATWRPDIEAAGLYDVFVWYPQGSNRSAKAPYKVVYNGGSVTVAVNQTTGGGSWKRIASSKAFLEGTAGYVQLGNGTGESAKNVMADAVRFTYAGALPVPPPLLAYSWNGSLLTLTWTNWACTLQQATALTGSPTNWTDVAGAASPHNVSIPGAAESKFFRLRQ